MSFRHNPTRRALLTGAATAGAALALPGGLARPSISRAADRPRVTHGLQSGDVTIDSGMVWARADRPSQMLVEIATTDSFRDARALPPIDALPETDLRRSCSSAVCRRTRTSSTGSASATSPTSMS